jgi:hypothetical protein
MNKAPVKNSTSSLKTAYWTVGLAGLVGTTIAALFYSGFVAAGIAAGALLGMANLWAISKLVYMLTSGDAPRPLFIMFGLVKVSAVGLALFFLISRQLVDPLGLLVGLATLPIGLTMSQLAAARPAQVDAQERR